MKKESELKRIITEMFFKFPGQAGVYISPDRKLFTSGMVRLVDDKVLLDGIQQLLSEAKQEMGQKLCVSCEQQEYGCNNSNDCPRNIAFKKWFGDIEK